jgi:hypothetical protein
MNINSENKQSIHDALIIDMQKRLYEGVYVLRDIGIDENDYTTTLESLTEDILHTNSVSDINNVLCDYDKLFPSEYLTLDGTLNYVLSLTLSYLVVN